MSHHKEDCCNRIGPDPQDGGHCCEDDENEQIMNLNDRIARLESALATLRALVAEKDKALAADKVYDDHLLSCWIHHTPCEKLAELKLTAREMRQIALALTEDEMRKRLEEK